MKHRLMIVALLLAILTGSYSQQSSTNGAKLPKHFRFIYNCDGVNMFTDVEPPMTPATLHPYVDEIAQTGATSLFISPNIGMVMNYPSKVCGMIGEDISPELAATILPDAKAGTLERAIINIRSLVNAGHDPLKVIINRAKEKKMESFISFRPNEVHAVEQKDNVIFSSFWRNHPEWRIGSFGDRSDKVYHEIMGPHTSPIVTKWLPGGLNFAIPQVREYNTQIIKELCGNYESDGIEIDFQRFPKYFKPGEEQAGIALMTEWMREIKKVILECSKGRSRPMKLTCRIMATPEQNAAIGLDPETWAREKIVDFMVVSHYLHNDFPLPIKAYRKLLPDEFPVYASIEVSKDINTYKNIADYLWSNNINGVYLFNFFTSREVGREPDFNNIRAIGYPSLLKQSWNEQSFKSADQPLLLVANKHSNTLSFVHPVSLQVLQTISTGPNPHEIAITPDQHYTYLSSYEPPGNTISVIDLEKRKMIRQINTGKFKRIHGVAIAPDGKNAYFTAGESGVVLEVDVKTQKISRAIPTYGTTSHMVYVSPNGKTIYTGNISSGDISVIDRTSGKLIKRIPTGKGAGGMAFTPDEKYLWVTNETDESISIVDISTHELIKTFSCPGTIKRIKFTGDGKYALLTSWTKKGFLIVLDAVSHKEIKRIPVGDRAIGVELSPDGKRAFVGCEDSKEVVIMPDGSEQIKVKPGDSDGIHVIDMQKLDVISIIKTGLGPDPMALWFPTDSQFKDIFNGRDLTGWKIHGTEKWYVKNGELICENGPDKEYGYLSTTKMYKNFILTLKFKQEVNGNSGVFIRSSIEGTKISGWQVEVAPQGHHTGGIYESYGRGWLIKPQAEDESVLKPGQWNDMRIEVRGNNITTWLNNKQMVHLSDAKVGAANGFIALQIHSGDDIFIRWKDIKIKEL